MSWTNSKRQYEALAVLDQQEASEAHYLVSMALLVYERLTDMTKVKTPEVPRPVFYRKKDGICNAHRASNAKCISIDV